MDHVLVTFLFEEAVIGGKNKDSAWKSETLKRAARLVEKVCCFPLKNDNIRSRLKTLRSHWVIVHEAATQSGFNFNFITNLVEADDISWVEYVKAHPNAAHVREKPLKYYTELCQIFSKDSARGDNTLCADDQTSPRPRKNGPSVDGLDEDNMVHLSPSGDPFGDVNMSTAASGENTFGSKRASSTDCKKKGKKTRRPSHDEDVMVSTCKALENVAKEIAQCFKMPDYTSLDTAIESIEGLTREQGLQALEIFAGNKDLIPLFLGMSEGRRGEWLKYKLGGM